MSYTAFCIALCLNDALIINLPCPYVPGSSALPPSDCRAASILKDPTHPQHGLFTLLPSGRRYRSVKCRTTRLKNSFFPTAIRLLNHWQFTIAYLNNCLQLSVCTRASAHSGWCCTALHYSCTVRISIACVFIYTVVVMLLFKVSFCIYFFNLFLYLFLYWTALIVGSKGRISLYRETRNLCIF